MARKQTDPAPRFGIGEWFGNSLVRLTNDERRYYAKEVLKGQNVSSSQPCPFQARKQNAKCNKKGGVCSLRLYSYAGNIDGGYAEGKPFDGPRGELRVTCPLRFHERLEIFKWVGETILGDENPILVGEVGFLQPWTTIDTDGGGDVGRIDMVLVRNRTLQNDPIVWCALEIQAVYFSGDAMSGEFNAYSNERVDTIIFPAGKRRPDYRSSAPKRLMPQLQIKVPTLRRWGKKMAVVVDRAFFDSLGPMETITDISNADIAWFIVRFEEPDNCKQATLIRDKVRFTTLERSVEGLTGGRPVSLAEFENRIAEQLTPSKAHKPVSGGACS